MTVLFCDIVGSTPLATQLDPEEFREMLREYQLRAGAAVAATGGYVARVIGDGLLVYFGWPNTDEMHAESAVRAGLAMVDAVRPLGLSIRIGIASGLVVIGDLMGPGAVTELMAVGETLHLASRLQALAEPGTILVCASTRYQVNLLFELEDCGQVELKGFDTPQRVWRVHRGPMLSGRSEALFARTAAPIVDREQELEFLVSQWRQTVAGDGRVVLLSGEPGIGKSRLLAALEERLANERHFSLRYFCSPHHQYDALYPIISRWEREAEFARGDSPADKLRKLQALATSRGIAPTDVPLLATMLSVPLDPSLDLSAQRLKEKTFDLLIGRLADLVKVRPLLVLFEDAHWADPTTLQLVEAGIDRLAGLPVFRIISFRPEFVPPWTGRPNVTLMTLQRLDRHHSEELASQIAAQQALPPSLRDRIVQQTDGVPLFIEEMTKAVIEETSIQLASADTIVVPSSLRGSLMARLDRLPIAKEVAQISAVIGRNFSNALLAAIAGLEGRLLYQGLQELVASGLVFQQGVGADALYAFKHALVRDVAYESLPRNRRAQLHGSIVSVSETDSSVGTMRPSRLGHHCAQAGLIAKAARYYRAAGEHAAEHAGLSETRNHLERGLSFARSLPDGSDSQLLEAELLIALGRLLIAMKGQSDPEAYGLFERAVALCRDLGDTEMLARSLFALGAMAMSRGELETVETISQDLFELAKRNQNRSAAIAGNVRFGVLTFYQGRLDVARESLSRVLGLCSEQEGDLPDFAITSSPDVVAAAYLGNTMAHLGYPERAVAHAEQAVERAIRLGKASLAYAMALSASARVCQTIGDEARCYSYTEALLSVAGEQGYPQYLAVGQCLQGWLTARQGDIAAGARMLSQALDVLASLAWQREAAYVNGLMADVLAWANRKQEAIGLLDGTLQSASRSGVTAFDARLRCSKAAVLAADGDFAEAEHEFRQAMDIARSQSARLFELQSCSGLAALLMNEGRFTEAHGLLEPVCDWFTESPDLPAVRKARETLAACNRATAGGDHAQDATAALSDGCLLAVSGRHRDDRDS